MQDMRCEILILGATVAAAGILAAAGDRAMVVESRPDAGYEFFGALRTKKETAAPVTGQAQALQAQFAARENLRSCAPLFYATLQGKRVLLGTSILSLERREEGFAVVACGAAEELRIFAGCVVDTRTEPRTVGKKSLNVLLYPEETERIFLPVEADMTEARRALSDFLATLPEGQRVLAVADAFDYELSPLRTLEEDGILRLASAGFDDPIAAYDAGVLLGEELCR